MDVVGQIKIEALKQAVKLHSEGKNLTSNPTVVLSTARSFEAFLRGSSR